MSLQKSFDRFHEKNEAIKAETRADAIDYQYGDGWKEITLRFGDSPECREIVIGSGDCPVATDLETRMCGSGESVGQALIDLGQQLERQSEPADLD
jgi:hypothetical protein